MLELFRSDKTKMTRSNSCLIPEANCTLCISYLNYKEYKPHQELSDQSYKIFITPQVHYNSFTDIW